MALEQSKRSRLLTQQNNIIANTILKIEDDAFPEVFGTVGVNRALRIGDFLIGDGSKIGDVTEDENSRPWIMEKGTTNNVTQKVDTDKPGGGSSIATFTLKMLDKNNQLTEMFSPSVRVPDILGLKASVYWMPQQGSFPEDATPIFRGIISTVKFGAGNASLIIDSPEQLKRQDLLPKYTSKITAGISDLDTSVSVETISGFVFSADALVSYIRIEDEIMEVVGFGVSSFNVSRGALGTTAVAHDTGSESESFYRLIEDSPIDLALKLILSGSGNFAGATISRFNQINATTFIQNAILIKDIRFQEKTGLVVGDLFTSTGASNASNNVTSRSIVAFSRVPEGTVVQLSGTDMVIEGAGASASFSSQYDVLNFGCSINPFHVDIERFQDLKDLIGTQQPDFDGYIRDTINARDYIDAEILFPSGMFGVFRKGRISIGANLPPLSSQNTKALNADTVKKAAGINITRSFKQKFYNATVYKTEQNVLDERYLAGRIIQSSDSTNRINIGNKSLIVEAQGIRDTPINRNKLDVLGSRVLDRYQYGAETIGLEVNFKTGFSIEIGDSVIMEGESLDLSDSNTGTRDYISRVLEVINKSFDLKSGRISLTVIDSVFQTNARYGVISPASFLSSGSTTTTLNLKRSFATIEGVAESIKWQDYVGQRIQVRSPDFSFSEIVTFLSIDPSDANKLTVSPALSVAPLEDYIIESPNYDDTNQRTDSFYKSQHVYPAKEISVTSGVSSTQFNVSVPDSANIVVGNNVLVHSPDYSDEIEVEVTGNTAGLITVEDMGFTPDDTYGVINIKFLDNSFVYRAF